MRGIESKHTTYIDTHCHYHPSITFAEFFSNITKNIPVSITETSKTLAICLVEMAGSNWFSLLESEAATADFCVERIDKNTLLVRSEKQSISVFRAHQVNSLEKVEVIIVGHEYSVAEGLPLKEYFEKYSAKYLVILPWGVGKWLGERGKLVSELIQQEFLFALGDNGGRPSLWSFIPQFIKAKNQKMPILAGSDPLAVRSFVKRLAFYGSIFNGEFNQCHVWINEVKKLNQSPQKFGHVCTVFTFIFDQLGLRLNKRT